MWKASVKAQNFAKSLRILDRSYYDMDKKKKKTTDNKNSKCLSVPPNDSSTKSWPAPVVTMQVIFGIKGVYIPWSFLSVGYRCGPSHSNYPPAL